MANSPRVYTTPAQRPAQDPQRANYVPATQHSYNCASSRPVVPAYLSPSQLPLPGAHVSPARGSTRQFLHQPLIPDRLHQSLRPQQYAVTLNGQSINAVQRICWVACYAHRTASLPPSDPKLSLIIFWTTMATSLPHSLYQID